MTHVEITIDVDAPCKRCGEKGAMPSGYCLKCLAVFIGNGYAWPQTKPKAKR